MGYLYLCIALIAGTTKGFCGKKVSTSIHGTRGALAANLLRMLLCTIIGIAIIFLSGDLNKAAPSLTLILIGGLSGLSTAVFVVTWLLLVRKSAYMLLDVFLMLGVLVPLIGCQVLYGESIDLKQLFGILLLLVATGFMCGYNNQIKTKLTPAGIGLLILCGLANGITDFSQKIFVKTLPDTPPTVLNLYTYLFAALALVIVYGLMKKESLTDDRRQTVKAALYITVMAISLFLHTYGKTAAAQHLDAVLLYPLLQGAALILSTAMATVFFKERLHARCIIALLITFLGLLFINVL
jgi:drug/metabolite transporter (DMT)-like permease